jgi:Domain of unknown function (DUF2804), C-terminal
LSLPAGSEAALAALPWRGPPEERPALPVPPQRMPLRLGGRFRKRWRWVGAFGERLIVFGAIVEIGPAPMTFWGIWDRERRRLRERTRRMLPGARLEVGMPGRSMQIRSGQIEVDLELGEGNPIECMCPNDEGGYTWTRKLAAVPVTGEVRLGGRREQLEALAVEDDSAGYHPRHTVWKWSAGVGQLSDGRSVGWNLVRGINDPPQASERAIWVDGEPGEPGPVTFDGLEGIGFGEGSRLRFSAETERVHHASIPLLGRSDYRAPFGTFSGGLPGLELASGLGVIESHDVLW